MGGWLRGKPVYNITECNRFPSKWTSYKFVHLRNKKITSRHGFLPLFLVNIKIEFLNHSHLRPQHHCRKKYQVLHQSDARKMTKTILNLWSDVYKSDSLEIALKELLKGFPTVERVFDWKHLLQPVSQYHWEEKKTETGFATTGLVIYFNEIAHATHLKPSGMNFKLTSSNQLSAQSVWRKKRCEKKSRNIISSIDGVQRLCFYSVPPKKLT